MNKAIDFIKDFDSALFGLGSWDIWISLGIFVLVFILANSLTSFLQPTTSRRIRKILNIVFYAILGGVLLFVVLNSILIKHYDKLTVMLFLIILPSLKKWVGNFSSGTTSTWIA